MNIQITYNWLKEHLKTSATPQQLAEYLSLCGPSVESLEKHQNDWVFDFEVTTNRVDMMSVIGLAREAGAILPRFNIKAKYQPPKPPEIKPINKLKLEISDPENLCPRIMAVVLDKVNLTQSPPEMLARLEAAGMRGLNNAVDITNYVMLEVGHPTHVFDYDRIKSKKLLLRLSKPGEKMISLENKSYTLPGGDIVIDNSSGEIIDLPGIIGTANSVVTKDTKKVVFFLESNDAVRMRQTSMNLNIRTQAAVLNEKGVDPQLAPIALKRGVELFKKLTGAQVASKIFDLYPIKVKPKHLKVSLQLIKDRLGVKVDPQKVSSYIQPLGFKTKYLKDSQEFRIQVPSWRQQDVSIPEDIVEEVARIYGYHRLPSKLMPGPIPTNYPNDNFQLEHQVKQWLAGWGLNEVYTNSMVSQEMAQQSGYPVVKHLEIKNALSEDWKYLRRSLSPSHLDAIFSNSTQKDLDFFELANIYIPQKAKLPQEKMILFISSLNSYQYLKGIIEALFEKLNTQVAFVPQKTNSPEFVKNQSALIKSKTHTLGTIGKIQLPKDPPVDPVFGCSLDFRLISQIYQPYPQYQPLSGYSPIIEDLTFSLPEKTYIGQVISTALGTDKTINQFTLSKKYQNRYTFSISYQSPKKQLSSTDITPVRKKLVANLESQFNAKLIGKI